MTPDTIILHHSLTEDGPTVSWGAIRNYHTSWKCRGRIIDPQDIPAINAQGLAVEAPWNDIGYHFGIEMAWKSFEIMLGRMPDTVGAHCTQRGMNRRSIGICFVGNYDLTPVPREMWEKGVTLVRWLMRDFRIGVDRVIGHRDMARDKTCPGKLFDMDRFRNDLVAV